jgi:hypothetical protein
MVSFPFLSEVILETAKSRPILNRTKIGLCLGAREFGLMRLGPEEMEHINLGQILEKFVEHSKPA